MPPMIGCAWVWGFQSADAVEGDGGACDVCVPSVPSGWQGPLEIFEGSGTPPPTLPVCSGDYPNSIFDGSGDPSAAMGCSCTCDPPSGITCSTPKLNYFSDPACATSCSTEQDIATSCTVLSEGTCGGGAHFTFGAPVASGGSCAPHATTETADAGSTSDARLCAMAAMPVNAGCGSAEICASRAESPFESRYCILQTGTIACPAQYPVQHLYSGGGSGSCSPCTCDAPTGASCDSGVVTFSNGPSCGGTNLTATVPESCTALGGVKSALSTTLSPTGGDCAPHGGEPSTSTATTVCCTP